MTTAAATRRPLSFDALDAVVADARALLQSGYTKAGNWSLGQACGHLAAFVRYPLDGFPRLPAPIRVAMWAFRNTVGPGQKRKVLAAGAMPAGMPTLTQTVPPAGADDAAGVREYAEQIERLKAFAGTPHPSPYLGPLTRDELVRATCIHAAHHLSFLAPAQH